MFLYLPASMVISLSLLFGLLGLVMGSALNCLAIRLVSGRSWSGRTRSCCPACSHVLQASDLVPVVSWLILRGKCRYCKSPISKRYPLTELLMALCYVALFLKYGWTSALVTPLILASCLLCLSLVDLDIQIIPNRFILLPMLCRGAELLLTGGLAKLFSGMLPGMLTAGSVLLISLVMDRIWGRETMGGGDIKLLFAIGMFLPLGQCLLMLMISCILGILMAMVFLKTKPGSPFPFGPALSAAAMITLLIGEPVIAWYTGLF